nr:acyltransferase [Propionibacterium sp.]
MSDAPAGMLIGVPLNAKRNSLNLVRLVLASSVIVHHSFPLTDPSYLGPNLLGDGLGGWAVIGFFALSGYLITGSRWGKSFGDYLMLRIARLYPAFLVCMVLTSLVFAPLNYWHVKGSLQGFWSTPTTPFNYVFANIGLKMNVYDVAGTPLGVPYPRAWNGSLWSLYYEFFCYLLVGVLGIFAIARRSPWPMLAAWAVATAARVFFGQLAPYWGAGWDMEYLTKLVPYFFAGGVLHTLKRRVGMHWLLALASAAAFLGLLVVNTRWGGQVGSVFAAYFLLYLGHVLPSPNWVRVHDISYGMYIYGFPTQQLVMTFAPQVGFWGLIATATAGAAVLAAASWFWLESPIINRARASVAVEHASPAPPVPRPGEAPTLG